MAAEGHEQHFILRVQSPELAAWLRAWLRDTNNIDEPVRLLFEQEEDRQGTLLVDGQEHPVVLQDLPTVVESYKTLDDANLVKVADIGQVLLVVDPALGLPDSYESFDGVTPPMRKARSRHFRPRITLPAGQMQQAVADVLDMLGGKAPEGYNFHDVEEEYVLDPATGQGRWVPVKPTKQPRAAAPAAAEQQQQQPGKRGGRAAAKKGRGAAGDDSGGEEDVEMTDSD